jgi:hypothetical protein
VQNGLLYGVGNGGGVFVIDTNTAVTTFVSELTVAAPGVTGAAYTNNDFNQSSTGTTLFDLDTNLDQIASSEPASRSRTTPSPCSRSAATGGSTRSSSQPGRRPASARSSPWWTSRFH